MADCKNRSKRQLEVIMLNQSEVQEPLIGSSVRSGVVTPCNFVNASNDEGKINPNSNSKVAAIIDLDTDENIDDGDSPRSYRSRQFEIAILRK